MTTDKDMLVRHLVNVWGDVAKIDDIPDELVIPLALETLQKAAAELAALRTVEGWYRTVCTNLQEFTHRDGHKIGHGGENVDEVVIKYARQLEVDNAVLREALAEAAMPYEALLIDRESRNWIAPEVWTMIEHFVQKARKALGIEKGN